MVTDARTAGPRRSARWGAVALAVLVVSFALNVTAFTVFDSPVDFYVYYMAGEILHDDVGPYDVTDAGWDRLADRLGIENYTRPYRYPPYTAAIGRAMGPLGPHTAAVVWEVANALAFIAGAWLLGSALGGGRRLALSLGLMLVWAPAYHTLLDGQVSGLVFVCLAAAVWGLLRGREAVAGTATALAAALKLTPFVLIPYLAWRRRWRATLWALAALVVVTVLTLPLAPWHQFTDYAANAYELTDPQRINLSPQNQSFTAVAGRALLESTTWESGGRADVVRGLAVAFALLIVAVTAFVVWPRRRFPGGGGRLDALGYGMVIAGSLMVGTFTYFHQFSWLFVPLLLVVDRLIASRRWTLLTLLLALVVAAGINEVVWLLFRYTLYNGVVWRVMDAPFLLAATLWAACGWLGWRTPSSGVGSRESGNRVP